MGPHILATIWVLVAVLVECEGQTEEDEKRPYKFAFSIEGYQHRSEEKDERGIIMGEFGFVTGDGVYHVTVYATDENGDFKILSMKNFYIGLPGEGTTVAPTKAPTRPPSPTPARPPQPTPTKSAIQKHLDGLMGCGGCIVTEKKTGQPDRGLSPPKGADGIDVRFGDSPGITRSSKMPGVTGGKPAYNEKSSGVNSPGVSSQGIKPPIGNIPQVVSPQYPTHAGELGSQYPQSRGKESGIPGPSGSRFGQPPSTGVSPSVKASLGPSSSQGQLGGQQVQKTGVSAGGVGKPSPPGTPQYSEGLPPGMTMDDLMALLYKFNYTLKYHGHHESGYRNGDKEGGYFFNGRDGLGRNVKYIANEFGFQPNITLVDLGLQAPDTPKEVNEEPNELRGNEFKWFYKR